MNILKNAVYVTPTQRRAIVFLTLVVTLTSVRVQAAEIAELLPEPPKWVTESPTGDDTDKTAQGIIVPVDATQLPTINPAFGGTPPSYNDQTMWRGNQQPTSIIPSAPAKKKWNKINSPDLETQPEYSSEKAARTLVVPVSAYTSDPRETDSTPFTTADGARVRDGIIAANFLKLGARVRLPDHFGDKVFVVHDRMNARYYQRIDIWMQKKSDAKNWGVRRVKVEVLP